MKDGVHDSYEKFLKNFGINKKAFYDFGLESTIYMPDEKVAQYWEVLKKRVLKNEEVFIRGYGRDAKGTNIYINFHKEVVGNERIIKDPTNNTRPQKLVEELTGLKRKKQLLNYQVSHVFGMTRNAFMFEAPWNIVLVPKIIDPLTGHESNGEWAEEYQKLFYERIHDKYRKYICEYNQLIMELSIQEKIKDFVEGLEIEGDNIKKIEKKRRES